jgi:hypothetical protein
MSKNILDKTFNNGIWFKGQGLTVRQVLEWAASHNTWIIQKPSLKQSDCLFDPINYDYVLKAEGAGSYRLTEDTYNYYMKRKEFWKQWEETKKPEYLEDIYPVYNKMVYEAMMKVPEYADYDRAYHKTLTA